MLRLETVRFYILFIDLVVATQRTVKLYFRLIKQILAVEFYRLVRMLIRMLISFVLGGFTVLVTIETTKVYVPIYE